MGKYEPLRQFLTGRREASARVTFREIEDILGFRLPASARKHPPWWSNSGGTHTQSGAWLTVGWKTSQVDIPGEMVTFTRDIERSETGPARTAPGVSESGTAFLGAVINVPVDRLTPAGQALVERYAQEEGGDVVAAIVRALQEAAKARTRGLLEEIARTAPKIGSDVDVVEVIRQMREERDEHILGS